MSRTVSGLNPVNLGEICCAIVHRFGVLEDGREAEVHVITSPNHQRMVHTPNLSIMRRDIVESEKGISESDEEVEEIVESLSAWQVWKNSMVVRTVPLFSKGAQVADGNQTTL